jgi:hypothetical protein
MAKGRRLSQNRYPSAPQFLNVRVGAYVGSRRGLGARLCAQPSVYIARPARLIAGVWLCSWTADKPTATEHWPPPCPRRVLAA